MTFFFIQNKSQKCSERATCISGQPRFFLLCVRLHEENLRLTRRIADCDRP